MALFGSNDLGPAVRRIAISGLDQALDIAMEERNPAAMVRATMSKAKIHGLVTGKKRVELGGRVDFDHEGALTFVVARS